MTRRLSVDRTDTGDGTFSVKFWLEECMTPSDDAGESEGRRLAQAMHSETKTETRIASLAESLAGLAEQHAALAKTQDARVASLLEQHAVLAKKQDALAERQDEMLALLRALQK